MPTSEVYIALGSNAGDRRAHLEAAIAKLSAHPQISLEARSQLYASQSVESGGEGDFFNAVVRLQTSLTARELLQLCLEIERESGRPAPPRVGPRTVDLDILLFGDERHAQPDLTIPHPRALGRTFVLRPLLDVLQGGWTRLEEW